MCGCHLVLSRVLILGSWFWAIKNELQQFLPKGNSESLLLTDEANGNTIAFLVDITEHLNYLNLKLQGQRYTICDLVSTVNAFQEKLKLYWDDLNGEKLQVLMLETTAVS